jgi:putative spermidine/putrescine transport system permease protein
MPGAVIISSLVIASLILLRYSLNAWDPIRTMTPAWTGANYAALFTDVVVRRAFLDTLRLSLIVTLICLVLGYPVAYGIARSRHRELLMFLLVAPLLMDVLLRSFGWLILLGHDGLVNALLTHLGIWAAPRRLIYTPLSVVVELVHELIPFMVLPIAGVLERIDPTLYEAAMNLRATPVRTLRFVTLPLSLPGVLAGTLLVFALAMSAFVAPLILGGGNVLTMTILIQQQMLTTLNWPLGSAESIALVVVVLLILAAYGRQVRRISRSGT